MFFIIIGFFLLSSDVFAQSPGLGSCPSVTTEKSLNRTKLSGKWYLAEASKPNLDALFIKCFSVNVSEPSNKHGTAKTHYSMVSTIFSPQHWENHGTAKLDSNACGRHLEGCAKLSVQMIGMTHSLWILGTDYDSFVVVWSCRELFIAHLSMIKIYTRKQHPNQSVLDKAAAVLAKSNLQNIPREKSRQDCS